jgi:hypothetical protein
VSPLKQGDLVFVQGKGLVARIIRFFDKGTFSHVAIAINPYQVIEADIDTKVAVRHFEKTKYNKVEVIDLGLNFKQRQSVYLKSLEYLDTKYDYIQLLWYGLRKIFNLKGVNKLNSPHNFICSELVYIVLDEAGILENLGIKDRFHNGTDLTPNELYDLVKFVSKK